MPPRGSTSSLKGKNKKRKVCKYAPLLLSPLKQEEEQKQQHETQSTQTSTIVTPNSSQARSSQSSNVSSHHLNSSTPTLSLTQYTSTPTTSNSNYSSSSSSTQFPSTLPPRKPAVHYSAHRSSRPHKPALSLVLDQSSTQIIVQTSNNTTTSNNNNFHITATLAQRLEQESKFPEEDEELWKLLDSVDEKLLVDRHSFSAPRIPSPTPSEYEEQKKEEAFLEMLQTTTNQTLDYLLAEEYEMPPDVNNDDDNDDVDNDDSDEHKEGFDSTDLPSLIEAEQEFEREMERRAATIIRHTESNAPTQRYPIEDETQTKHETDNGFGSQFSQMATQVLAPSQVMFRTAFETFVFSSCLVFCVDSFCCRFVFDFFISAISVKWYN